MKLLLLCQALLLCQHFIRFEIPKELSCSIQNITTFDVCAQEDAKEAAPIMQLIYSPVLEKCIANIIESLSTIHFDLIQRSSSFNLMYTHILMLLLLLLFGHHSHAHSLPPAFDIHFKCVSCLCLCQCVSKIPTCKSFWVHVTEC